MNKKRSNHLASLGLFVAVWLSGCNGLQVNPLPASPQPSVKPVQTFDQSWLVNLIVRGGFAGIQRSMELSSNGELQVMDDGSGKQVFRSIPASDLAKFTSLVSEVVQVKNDSLPPCADCFVYQVFIRRDNNYFSATLNDINLEESGWSELIHLLMGLGNDSLGY